ncbi:hypothetical protein CC80DRAFT_83421 [Byssothecium circinans]|uniref:Uncharacterized protein n=1 Tax=Byssothecium circinans TaxID=147558 RepID=A0A6A5TUL5_9PLEO|nr:hypothetical protein CC80DRAFT_83421 [Byssothecium circinans]
MDAGSGFPQEPGSCPGRGRREQRRQASRVLLVKARPRQREPGGLQGHYLSGRYLLGCYRPWPFTSETFRRGQTRRCLESRYPNQFCSSASLVRCSPHFSLLTCHPASISVRTPTAPELFSAHVFST